MKKLLYTILAVSIIFSACEKDEEETPNTGNNNGNNITELEGTWVGWEVGDISTEWTIIFSEDKMNVNTSPLNLEWYISDYSIDTLVIPREIDGEITNCSLSSYIGTITKGIYKIENDTTLQNSNTILTYYSCEPGIQDRPSSFLDASVIARTLVLIKQ